VPLLITNYTSNRLQFSPAVERVRASELIENVTVLDKAVRTDLRDGHHVRVAADGLGYGHGRRQLRRGRQDVVQSVLQRLGMSVVPPLLALLAEAVDDMGGTLSAIFGVLLSAWHASPRTQAQGQAALSPPLYASSMLSAVEAI
jgi:hypothetical protein